MPEITVENGFEEFYERNYRMVYRVCFTYMKDKPEAEDCAKDVFVKVMTGSSNSTMTHEKKWLTITAVNLCKDRLKHWFRRKVSSMDGDFNESEG